MYLVTPSKQTLKKYGLSADDFWSIALKQKNVCAVCKQLPKSNRLCIDHEHVRGWKKLKPEERKRYVRGLLCWRCNHYFVGRGISVERAENVVRYLADYQQRETTCSAIKRSTTR